MRASMRRRAITLWRDRAGVVGSLPVGASDAGFAPNSRRAVVDQHGCQGTARSAPRQLAAAALGRRSPRPWALSVAGAVAAAVAGGTGARRDIGDRLRVACSTVAITLWQVRGLCRRGTATLGRYAARRVEPQARFGGCRRHGCAAERSGCACASVGRAQGGAAAWAREAGAGR